MWRYYVVYTVYAMYVPANGVGVLNYHNGSAVLWKDEKAEVIDTTYSLADQDGFYALLNHLQANNGGNSVIINNWKELE
jgi:hypothetical protein